MPTIAVRQRATATYGPAPGTDALREEHVDPYLDITIDGRWLEQIIAELFSDTHYRGLVPCLLPWQSGPPAEATIEARIARERFLPHVGMTAIAPVLMCPDDLDFFCTLVVAAIRNTGATVEWRRIGSDTTDPSRLPEHVGESVRWVDGFTGWSFDLAEYVTVFEAYDGLEPMRQ
jgi:hypothetical protein